MTKERKQTIQSFREQTDSDIIIINSTIDYSFINLVDRISHCQNRRSNISLFITTFGGNADNAYSFAKTLQACYAKFTIYITSFCKSAGTLIALGANEVVFTNTGELGPLDVQTYKPDEFFNFASGLDIIQALRAITSQSYLAYEYFFYHILSEGKGTITTQTAGDLAINLTRNFIEPIAQQIDPLQLGEMNRKIKISEEYGKRLSENLPYGSRESIVGMLTRQYPSHGFVIDYEEASKLLGDNCVRMLQDNEIEIYNELKEFLRIPRKTNNPYIDYITNDYFKSDKRDASKKTSSEAIAEEDVKSKAEISGNGNGKGKKKKSSESGSKNQKGKK